jgi:UTP-glucose-1-phosphate uridylyltransferase
VIREPAKELAMLGGEPILLAPLLEAAAVGSPPVVIVTSPTKPQIRAAAEQLLDRPSLRGLEVVFVEQPLPVGVFDAVARAAAVLGTERLAVVFPDFVHLPDQTGLGQVLAAAAPLPETASFYAVFRKTRSRAARMGGSARVELGEGNAVTEVGGAADTADPWHTGLVELRGTEFARRVAGLGDRGVLDLLRGLAADGQLYGAPLTGELLDIGVPAGFRDAAARFHRGEAQWRDATSS